MGRKPFEKDWWAIINGHDELVVWPIRDEKGYEEMLAFARQSPICKGIAERFSAKGVKEARRKAEVLMKATGGEG